MLSRRLRLAAGRLVLSRRLRRALPPAARSIMAELSAAGHAVFLVGGCVRDLLTGAEPRDWDMVTAASASDLLALFPAGRAMGSTRGGVTVIVPRDGAPFEVTPYRGAGLHADLARRDFTINAMALNLDGTLHDPLNGRSDLARGVVRACESPADRLTEDPLRMLRAVRLAAQFGLTLDPHLVTAITTLAPRLAAVAPERIGAEFARLMVTDRAAWALERLREFGLLASFAPELLEMVGVEQNQFHAYPVWEHCLMAVALIPPQLPLRLAALLHDAGKPRSVTTDGAGDRHFYGHELVSAELADSLLTRLRFPGDVRQAVVHLVRYHMDLHLEGPVTDGAIRRMIRRIGVPYMGDLIELRRADRLASGMREGDLSAETIVVLQHIKRVLAGDAALKVADLAVNGDDVVAAFDRSPGPYVGEVLERLLDEVVEEPSRNTRPALLSRLAELSRGFPGMV